MGGLDKAIKDINVEYIIDKINNTNVKRIAGKTINDTNIKPTTGGANNNTDVEFIISKTNDDMDMERTIDRVNNNMDIEVDTSKSDELGKSKIYESNLFRLLLNL